MGPGLAHLGTALGRKWLRSRKWLRIRARLRRGFSIGIAGRLATSFAAVAALAIAANVMIEREIAVVQTTRVDRGQYSPAPAVRTPSPAPGAAPLSPASRETPHTDVVPAEIDRFQAALEHYQRATEARVAMDTGAAEDERRAAQRDLDFAARAVGTGQTLESAVQTQLMSYERAGADYVESADQRRSVLQQYQDCLDAVETRITASMSRALKLFGRVFARQSLLRLQEKIDELQRHFTDVAAANVADPEALAALADSENALEKTFQADETSFSRSEGSEWVRGMHRDLSGLATLRAAGIETGNTLREETAKFAAARDRLLASVPEIVSESLTVLERPGNAEPARGVPPLPPAMASPIVDAVTTTTTTTTTVPDHDRRMMVAWITAAVLLVWLAISVWTMRSILIPVGRLIEATRRLARGEDVRAPRGGLKELNALSIAFNRMAFQLRTAREIMQGYRRTLETQVEQRTRLLQHLAEHDPLTLLANRRQFFILLKRSIERARPRNGGVAVFFIDLDNFKNLNDGMGHAFGDRVLISVAQRLEETAKTFGFAARLGGDEFTIVHEQVDSPQAALLAGHRIVSAFERPLSVEGRSITVSVSVGTSFYPDHEHTAESLLSAADAALFRAKALGRNQAALFTRELLEAATRKFTTEQGIRLALEREELELLFQPEVRLSNLRVGLVEALVRWRMPDGRLASPAEFLAVTEESGLILELGDWVLRRAIETAAHWQRTSWPDVKVAINVSPRQLLSGSFVDRVQRLLHEFELPARCIELELTESVLQTGAATIESLRQLHSLDIAIALDDFGTGYSSFASLEQLPLSRIKLDRALIAGIDTQPRSAAIAMALILLCEDLGIEVTAEGVERNTQFSCLAANPTLYVQGYLISPPVAEAEVPQLIATMPQLMHDLLLSIPAPSPRSAGPRPATGLRDLTRGAIKR
jgi:diguanylate cyclase (GGDEF)-like protein